MEKKVRAADKSLIQVILQKYRDCSVDSITGPTGIRKYEPNRHRTWPSSTADGAPVKSKQDLYVSSRKELDRAPFSAIASARLPASGVAAARQGPSKVKQTLLDGIPLACFNIGGEKRLCFDQLLADVLKEFSQSEVNTSRDHLKIYCPRCDEEQLESLKLSEVVPWSDSSCLLITKSDAYRLCSALLSNRAPHRHDKKYTKPFVDVYHECFGGCKGIFEPETYKEPHAKCVTCLECHRLFSPRKFVTHSHENSGEIQTCHWGMDSSKWRLYLLLPDENADDEATRKIWQDVKKRFASTGRKRKQSNSEGESLAGSDYGGTNAKRRAAVESKALIYSSSPNVERRSGTPASSTVSSPREHSEVVNRRSAFRPWSPLDDKPRVDSGSTSSESQTTTVVNCPNHMNNPFYHSSHIPFVSARNCSCPVSYSSLNGVSFVAHPSTPLAPKPVKTEYPGVICTQGIVPSQANVHANVRPSSPRGTVVSHVDTAVVEQRDDAPETNELNFASPERVKQVLNKYCHKGHLPSVDELSYALAKELREWSTGQAKVLDDVKEKGEKLREEMDSLRRHNAQKLDEACAELKCCREKLEHLNRNREDDLKEFAKTREALQRQVESLQEQRSSDTEMVKKLMNQLGERDTRCHLLEKELDYIRSWYIGSQRRYPAFQPIPVAVYGASNLRDIYCTQSAVIQEIPMYPRNGESPALGNKNKDEENEREANTKITASKEAKPETKDSSQ